MGAVPGHPFFLRVIDSLPQYNRNWLSPYITIMSSTGPLFLSLIWRHYNSVDQMPSGDRVRILFPDAYMGHNWSFFSHHVGNSWHKWDTQAIIWVSLIGQMFVRPLACVGLTTPLPQMSKHWVQLTVLGFAIAAVMFAIVWLAYHRIFLANKPTSPSILRRLPFLRWSSRKEYSIELEDRREV